MTLTRIFLFENIYHEILVCNSKLYLNFFLGNYREQLPEEVPSPDPLELQEFLVAESEL